MHTFLSGKLRIGFGQLQFLPQQVHQVFGVGLVVDHEVRVYADGPAVAAEQPHGDGMERAAPDLAGRQQGFASPLALCSLGRCRRTASARRRISAAARRVKVSRQMRDGWSPRVIRWATRCASVAVLPVPAPAMISSGSLPCWAALRCWGLSEKTLRELPRLLCVTFT